MAGLATHRNVLPAEGKLRPVVIEQAVRPERRVVTGLASGGESRRRVVRALRCTELRHVATSAILRRAFELVAYVALHATRLHVASGEGIARCRIVIELRTFPYRCGMAHRTVFRKTRRDVIRVVRWLAEIRLMAANTCLRRSTEAIVGVALLACGDDMLPGEWKPRLAMVEGSALPLQCGVTILTGRSESSGCMIRRLSIAELIQMAGGALLPDPGVAFVGMALLASYGSVLSGKREFRTGIVIKLRTRPLHGGVAHRAIGGESGLGVVRVCCLVQLGSVAGDTVLAQARELVVQVALLARCRCVLPGEGEFGRTGVVELCARPQRRRVTVLAGGGKPGSSVVGRLGLLKLVQVTGGAILA